MLVNDRLETSRRGLGCRDVLISSNLLLSPGGLQGNEPLGGFRSRAYFG